MISYNILQKRLIFQKYKKMFSRKLRHVAIRSGSIRWISIRFDAIIQPCLKLKYSYLDSESHKSVEKERDILAILS